MVNHARIRTSEGPLPAGGEGGGVSLPRTPRAGDYRPREQSDNNKEKRNRSTHGGAQEQVWHSPRKGGKNVQWDFKSSKLPVISPRVMVLRDGPQNLKGGLISNFKLPSEFDLIGKHSQENPAPWDYAEAQLKSAPLPPTSAIFSKSTENFYEDKWYRRTEFNSPERSDPTAMFPGPGAYDPIFKASSKCKRSTKALIGPIPPLSNANALRSPTSRPHIERIRKKNSDGEQLIGMETKPQIGMQVQFSKKEMEQRNISDPGHGTIVEVGDSGSFCMVEWHVPYPPDEQQFSICETSRHDEYWLAVYADKTRTATPPHKKWLLDAIVSPRYEYKPSQGIFALAQSGTNLTSLYDNKIAKSFQGELAGRHKSRREFVPGSIIEEVKMLVFTEAKQRELDLARGQAEKERLARRLAEKKKRETEGGSLKTVADLVIHQHAQHGWQKAAGLVNLFHFVNTLPSCKTKTNAHDALLYRAKVFPGSQGNLVSHSAPEAEALQDAGVHLLATKDSQVEVHDKEEDKREVDKEEDKRAVATGDSAKKERMAIGFLEALANLRASRKDLTAPSLDRFASPGAKATVNASLGDKTTDADSTILDEQSAEPRPLEESSVAGLSDSLPPPPSLFSAKASASPNAKGSASPNSKGLSSPGSKALASSGPKTREKQGIAENNLQELAGVKQSPLELSTLPVFLSVNKERADENLRTNVLLHKSTDSVSKTVLFGTKEDMRAMRKASKSILIVDDSKLGLLLPKRKQHTHIPRRLRDTLDRLARPSGIWASDAEKEAHLRNEGRGKGQGARRQMLQEASKMKESPELGQQHRAQKDAEIAFFNAEDDEYADDYDLDEDKGGGKVGADLRNQDESSEGKDERKEWGGQEAEERQDAQVKMEMDDSQRQAKDPSGGEEGDVEHPSDVDIRVEGAGDEVRAEVDEEVIWGGGSEEAGGGECVEVMVTLEQKGVHGDILANIPIIDQGVLPKSQDEAPSRDSLERLNDERQRQPQDSARDSSPRPEVGGARGSLELEEADRAAIQTPFTHSHACQDESASTGYVPAHAPDSPADECSLRPGDFRRTETPASANGPATPSSKGKTPVNTAGGQGAVLLPVRELVHGSE